MRAYAGMYLKEEVQAERLVRNLGDFARFLEVMSFSQGAVVNASNIARECQVSRPVLDGYLGLLEDMLLSFRVPVFSKRAKRALSSHPKFYFFDAGIYRSLRPRGPLDAPEETGGVALESLVAQHLRAWCDYRGEGSGLTFWRTLAGTEVDFVVYGPDGFWAVEVKNTGRFRESDLKGLKTFCADYPEARALYLYRGKDRLKIKNTLCLPVEEFLARLHPDRLLLAGF